MIKNSGDTQARFLAKSLAFFAISSRQPAFNKRKIYRKGTRIRKNGRCRFAQMNLSAMDSSGGGSAALGSIQQRGTSD